MSRKVHLERLSHVVYEHFDVNNFNSFAADFGLEKIEDSFTKDTVFFRGYGKDPFVYVAQPAAPKGPAKFIGGAFAARTETDYNNALQIEGAKAVDIASWPGGGKMALLQDPNGFEMRILWGQKEQSLPEHGISVLNGRPAMNGALDNDKYRRGELQTTCEFRRTSLTRTRRAHPYDCGPSEGSQARPFWVRD